MRRILVAWIGNTDLEAAAGVEKAGLGPIGQAVHERKFDRVELLSNYEREKNESYRDWLERLGAQGAAVHHVSLSRPTAYGEIYERAVELLRGLREDEPEARLFYHLSPGTPAMASVWLLLAKTRFPAALLESSSRYGVQDVTVPFDISVDFLPDLLRKPDEELARLTQGLPPEAPAFSAILHRSTIMKRLVARARRVAVRSVPVLLQGESGTGKELLARAIHGSNLWRKGPFVAVNCGAIPADLVESELFGAVKGAYSGATDRKGYLEAANHGTVFLDEIGELSLAAQVKLLRALQELRITRVGETELRPVDLRVIAATNRNLLEEVAGGRFREDLFHRIAVAVLSLPPLRERGEDLGYLIDTLLAKVNTESESDPGYEHKKLSVAAKNLLLQHSWPGNVRELENTLRRAVVWSAGDTITERDAREAILPMPRRVADGILDRPLVDGLSLPTILSDVARHYLKRALEQSKGNKTRAAKLLGLPSYQTLTNWMDRHHIEAGT